MLHCYLNEFFPSHFSSRGPGNTPYNGLYDNVPPERVTFFRLLVYKKVGISQAEVSEKVGKSVSAQKQDKRGSARRVH